MAVVIWGEGGSMWEKRRGHNCPATGRGGGHEPTSSERDFGSWRYTAKSFTQDGGTLTLLVAGGLNLVSCCKELEGS